MTEVQGTDRYLSIIGRQYLNSPSNLDQKGDRWQSREATDRLGNSAGHRSHRAKYKDLSKQHKGPEGKNEKGR
jgi:hypothetical protein